MTTPDAPSVRDKQARTVAARAELARRRALAEAATAGPWVPEWDSCDCGDGYGCSHGSWVHSIRFPVPVVEPMRSDGPVQDWHHTASVELPTSVSLLLVEHDPAHVLGVLDIHAALFDVVALHSLRCDCGACTVADRLLDLYAPEVPR